MKLISVLFLFSLLSLSGCANTTPFITYDILYEVKKPLYYKDMVVSKIISVYDGDTFRADLTSQKELPALISKNISIRLNGIDTPEIRGSSIRLTSIAKKAKKHTYNRLTNGNVIILKNIQRGMYFRIIAEVEVDGVNLNQELIQLGLARPYDGGSKRGLWDRRYKQE